MIPTAIQAAYLAYGNEYSMGSWYSAVAVLIEVPKWGSSPSRGRHLECDDLDDDQDDDQDDDLEDDLEDDLLDDYLEDELDENLTGPTGTWMP